MIFKYDELKVFFRRIKELGETVTFSKWDGSKVFLVRHDVDFDIKIAHDLALFEKECGIVSTYFILTSSDCYNIMSSENKNLLREIQKMGHEIGLHFDPTLYEDEELSSAVAFEAQLLSNVIGRKVKSISLHNPSVHGQFPLFDHFTNAYDPKLFSNENYISDSCKSFRGKDPITFLENIKNSMIQVLLHPMHYTIEGKNYEQVVCESLIRHANKIHSIFKVNKEYNQDIAGKIEESLKKYL